MFLNLVAFVSIFKVVMPKIQAICAFDSPLYSVVDDHNAVLRHFNNFTELDFKNCNQTQTFSTLQFIPRRFLIINSELDLKLSRNRRMKIISKEITIYIKLKLIKGFDLAIKNPFDDISYLTKARTTFWSFDDSFFDFYYNGSLIKYDSEYCNEAFFEKISYFTKMSFIESLVGVRFSNEMCPLVFKNAVIFSLELKRINYAPINYNPFGFREDNLKVDYTLNSNISMFFFTGYDLIIDNQLLNQKVFQSLIYIEIGGIIHEIQDDVFKSFSILKVLRFKIQHFSLFFHRGLKWLEYLNSLTQIDYSNPGYLSQEQMLILVFHQVFNFNFYDYPNEDICLFQYFPHERFVLPKLFPDTNTKCTCTRMFLIQYAYKYESEIYEYIHNYKPSYFYFYSSDEYSDKGYTKCINDSIEQVIAECNFGHRFNMCNIDTYELNEKKSNLNYFYVYDFIYFTKIFQILFSVYLLPFLSLICLMSILILVSFIYKEKSNLQNKIYFYLKVNLFFNCIFCVITPFRSFNVCVFTNGAYCSHFYKTIPAQYFYIINSQFLFNFVKTCSYWTSLSFTISRFYQLTGYLSPFQRLSNISNKKYLLVLVTISFWLNFHIFFEYSVHEYTNIRFGTDQFEREINKYPFYNLRDETVSSRRIKTILTALRMIKVVITDIFCLILSFIYDLLLFSFLKRAKHKKFKILNFKIEKLSYKQKQNSENAINRIKANMVLNLIGFFGLKFPMTVFSVITYFFSLNDYYISRTDSRLLSTICSYFRICNSFTEICIFIFLNSVLFEIFMLTKVDKHFHISVVRDHTINLFWCIFKNNS